MRIALGAAAALKTDATGNFALDENLLRGTRRGQVESKRNLGFADLAFRRGNSGGPPRGTRFEIEGVLGLREAFQLDAKIGHRS